MVKLFSVMLPALFGVFLSLTVHAEKIYTGFFSNKAAGGYDVVAYFKDNKAVEGRKEFQYEWQGADWYFSSESHLNAFMHNPTAYAPQYGGHCAWAIATKNDLVKGSPHYWKIVNGKLYLNYNNSIQNKWLKDIEKFITEGDRNWPDLNKS